ncbi:MAG: hypothetical protein RLZZ84_1935 [Pseudomonadota bacterium]|jgi:hypothetical protein
MADNRLLAQILRSSGGKLLNATIDKVLPVAAAVAEQGEGATAAAPRKKSLLGGLAGAMAVRIAARSVPGAIVIGGSLLAKRLYDRRHAKDGAATPPAKKDQPKA